MATRFQQGFLRTDDGALVVAGGTLNARDYLVGGYRLRDQTVVIDLAAAVAAMEATGKALYWPGGLWATAQDKNVVMNFAQTSFTYRIFGDGNDSRIYLPSGMGDGEFLLRCNQTAGGVAVLETFLSSTRVKVEGLFVVGSNSPNGGFLSSYQRGIVARQMNFFGGKYGIVTDGYADQCYLETIISGSLTAGGWTFWQKQNGDGLIVNGMTAYACGGVNVKGSQGAHINGLISGYHLLDACDATVSGAHLEGNDTTAVDPLLLIKNSRVLIPDGRYYTTRYRPAIEIDDSAAVGYRSKVTIGHQCTFVQRLDDPDGVGAYRALRETAINLKSFHHFSELRLLSVRQDFFGRTTALPGDGTYEQGTIKIASDDAALQTVIDGRAALLLSDVEISFKNGSWEVNPPGPASAVRTTRRVDLAVTVVGAAVATPQWKTNQAAGTRFYRAWTRDAENADTDKSAEVSITTDATNTNGKLTISGIVGPATIRLVRGTVANTYTEWIEFTTSNETVVLYDQGTVIGGQTWSSTSVPTPPTTNDTKDMIVFRRGPRRIAYGSAAPTSGTWGVGDKVIHSAPVASGPAGWMCVTAGTPGTWKAEANLAA